MLTTFVSNTSRASSPVSSAAGARVPGIPTLLMSVSMRASCASMSAAARATESSSVTSIATKRAPSRRRPSELWVARAEDDGVSEFSQAAGGLVAESLVRPGDEGDLSDGSRIRPPVTIGQGRTDHRKASTTSIDAPGG
jgi:hypothetical protein